MAACRNQLRPKPPKPADLMDQAEPDVLSSSPSLNSTALGCTEVVGIFPNEAAITRLVGAILLEQNNERAVQHARYITPESIAPGGDDPIIGLSTAAG